MQRSFHGGIRFSKPLHTAKIRALHSPIRVILPDRLTLALHTLKPCVQDGDIVRIGDRLAEDPRGFYPPLHSGLSGRVILHNDGITVLSDGKQTKGAFLPPLSVGADPTALVERMFDAGLVGLGGAGFPTHRKYRDVTANHLLINACECEPYLACDGRLVLEQPDTIHEGIAAFVRACRVPSNHVYLCAESPLVVDGLRRIARGTPWQVKALPERYPQGSERQLIKTVLGQEIPQDTYPAEHGFLVSNVATAAAMADALCGLPLTHRVVTVSGSVRHPCNLFVPIGTPLCTLIEQAEPLITGRRSQIILGGAMTGTRTVSSDTGLPKPCGGILVLPTEDESETPCIHCGACVRACPSGLMPYLIERSHLLGQIELNRELRPDACISCGCCSRVCPARRQLAARIRRAKMTMTAEKGDRL